jgi:hypothetical protein
MWKPRRIRVHFWGVLLYWIVEELSSGLVYLVDSAILRVGNPLQWQKSLDHLQFVRQSGYKQFMIHYNRCKELETPIFLWGYDYHTVHEC